jgi:hypothetical protein
MDLRSSIQSSSKSYHWNHPLLKGYVCYETRVPITVDGQLDEAEWQAVTSMEGLQDIQGEPKSCFRTRAKKNGTGQRLLIRQDSRIWKEDPR